MKCPCGSKQEFGVCCAPYLDGSKQPATAEALMRSRYVAYTKADIAYLDRTHAPETHNDDAAAAQRKWAAEAQFKSLQILATDKGGPGDSTGTVEFMATFKQNGQSIDHHEVSRFRKNDDGRWLFVDGHSHRHRGGHGVHDHAHDHHHRSAPLIRSGPKVGRNDPCLCGSGKKYKKCCGAAV